LFERSHHQRIAAVLEALDADLLAARSCWFGGGTAIVLRHGEYRESVDIDFLVADLEGYRGLRQSVTGSDGLRAIARRGAMLEQVRELRADQYGLRTLVRSGGVDIKFEIVLEARIGFDTPGPEDRVCGVATLTPLDLAASKLLANADRWRDDAVHSRDLIDLAMMRPTKLLLRSAVTKAEQAYGNSVVESLRKAIDQMRQRPQRLDVCLQALRMEATTTAVLLSRIKALERALDAS
jgi:hypothetical protein